MKRLIEYGDYSCAEWNGIINLEDPLFKAWFKSVKPYLIGYEFWIYGGVLDEHLTFDIDASIIGPYNPQHINWMLDNIVRISFEYGVFPDIKYSLTDTLEWRWSEWKSTGKKKTCKYAFYKPTSVVDGVLIDNGRFTLENGLWISYITWPINKTLYYNKKDGKEYKDPIQIA